MLVFTALAQKLPIVIFARVSCCCGDDEHTHSLGRYYCGCCCCCCWRLCLEPSTTAEQRLAALLFWLGRKEAANCAWKQVRLSIIGAG